MIARIEKRLLEPIRLWRVDTGILLKVRRVWGRSGGRGCGVGFIWIGMGIIGVLLVLVNTMSVLIQWITLLNMKLQLRRITTRDRRVIGKKLVVWRIGENVKRGTL